MFTKKQREKLEYFRLINERNIHRKMWMKIRITPTNKNSAVICWQRKNQSKYEYSEHRLFTEDPGRYFYDKYKEASDYIGCS